MVQLQVHHSHSTGTVKRAQNCATEQACTLPAAIARPSEQGARTRNRCTPHFFMRSLRDKSTLRKVEVG